MKILATLLALSLSAVALGEPGGSEHTFLDKATQGNLTDINAGKLAQSKGTSEPVKKFGAMMVEDHSAANKKLAAIAKAKSVAVPSAPSNIQTESIKALQAKDGERFDQEYIAFMVKIHEDSVKLLKSEIASGRDADTSAYAQEMLPTVESHLREASRLAGKAGKAATTQP